MLWPHNVNSTVLITHCSRSYPCRAQKMATGLEKYHSYICYICRFLHLCQQYSYNFILCCTCELIRNQNQQCNETIVRQYIWKHTIYWKCWDRDVQCIDKYCSPLICAPFSKTKGNRNTLRQKTKKNIEDKKTISVIRSLQVIRNSLWALRPSRPEF